jgi:hypothetical protein
MRLLKFLLGIFLLRWLPGGTIVSWLIRLGIWSWLLSLLIRRVKPFFSDSRAGILMRAPSGWTTAAGSAAPVEAFESTNISTTITSTPQTSTADASEKVETVTETMSETTRVWGAPPDETGGVEAVPPADQTPEMELAPEPDVPYVPKWVQGDGSIDCPAAFPVKAKVNSNIYYEPGSHHYSVAIPDVCFAAPEDAAAAGYRAPRR